MEKIFEWIIKNYLQIYIWVDIVLLGIPVLSQFVESKLTKIKVIGYILYFFVPLKVLIVIIYMIGYGIHKFIKLPSGIKEIKFFDKSKHEKKGMLSKND